MRPISRAERFATLFPKAPAFRLRQAEEALFNPAFARWEDVSIFPADMRAKLAKELPWISVTLADMRTNKKDTWKAMLKAEDGHRFETVLMQNARDDWTICVSSQIGCAMGCRFCATGALGLTRSLTSDEIIDQYRFWRAFLLTEKLEGRISNIVFMGMGEPMGNYDQVKSTIISLLKHTDIGATRITVSTVGVLPMLEYLLTDKEWPPVRLAVSLHSANQEEREAIVPSTVPEFHKKLTAWAKQYSLLHGNRRHHLTFEYTLLEGVNDGDAQAKSLITFLRKIPQPKLNVIPLNAVPGKSFVRSQRTRIDRFKALISGAGFDVTERRSMGEDIAAACGQLALELENHS